MTRWLAEPTAIPSRYYYDRTSVASRVREALARKQHVLLYGPPHHGKTTLVRHILDGEPTATLHASAETQFADIARNYLLAAGCSVTVERKKKSRLSSKAEIKFAWPIFSAGGSAEAGTEGEQTFKSFTADISNPNDVCHLLREVGSRPHLIIERFETLPRKQRALLFDFMQIAAESGVLQVILIASSLDLPLSHPERIQTSAYLTCIALPPLSRTETNELIAGFLTATGCPVRLRTPDSLYDFLSGSLGLTVDICAAFAQTLRLQPTTADEVELSLEGSSFERVREQARSFFLSFLATVIDRGWEIPYAERPPAIEFDQIAAKTLPAAKGTKGVSRSRRAAKLPPMKNEFASDQVYSALYYHLSETVKPPPTAAAALNASALLPLTKNSIAAARAIFDVGASSEAIRLLAFALLTVLENPLGAPRSAYRPAQGAMHYVNVGHLFCEFLMSSDPRQSLVLREEDLVKYFGGKDSSIVAESRTETTIARAGRRLRKLQRRLRIEPPVFQASEALDSISLWTPRHWLIFGDMRPHIAELLAELATDDEE